MSSTALWKQIVSRAASVNNATLANLLERPGRTMLLADGRTLGWREYGDADGHPIIFNHGNMNSRLFSPCWDKSDEVTTKAAVRVIAVERPGVGLSTTHAQRTLLTWSNDVRQLAEHLQVSKFSVAGFSSGGPHALAVASQLSDMVVSCGLISSDAPYVDIGPEMMTRMFKGSVESYTHERSLKISQANFESLTDDYEHMGKEVRKFMALADIHEACRSGLDGVASDAVLESAKWPFTLESIRVPVVLWHGEEDVDVPIEAARYIADRVPCKTKYFESETHSMIRRQWGAFITAVVAASKQPSL
eukprot:m.149586 g.149586  ORF g.149586 m.149586 type:complete len:304 (-) comp30669_c0_seq1:138-1049(-)